MYHVLNRSVAGLALFRKEADFEAFERIMIEAHGLHPLRILAWCAMRTHWHFLVWPQEEGEVTAYFRWLAHTHAMRWHVAHNTVNARAFVPGAFQELSHPGGRALPDGLPLRGAERLDGQCGPPGRGLAWGQSVGAAPRARRIAGHPERLAGGTRARIG